MKIKLVFVDWQESGTGKSIYNTERGIDLSIGPFHSGTTFDGEIKLDEADTKELKNAMKNGASPIFMMMD